MRVEECKCWKSVGKTKIQVFGVLIDSQDAGKEPVVDPNDLIFLHFPILALGGNGNISATFFLCGWSQIITTGRISLCWGIEWNKRHSHHPSIRGVNNCESMFCLLMACNIFTNTVSQSQPTAANPMQFPELRQQPPTSRATRWMRMTMNWTGPWPEALRVLCVCLFDDDDD